MRSLLLKVHRWAAIATAPFLLLITFSGMVLAFQPILAGNSAAAIEVPTLVSAIRQADPDGRAESLTMAPDGKSFDLRTRRSALGTFDTLTGTKTGEPGFDVFGFARALHVSLLLGARWLVTFVTIVSVIIIVLGFSGRWTKFRHTLSGWHNSMGWWMWPLAALTPVTGMLMALHLGMPYQAGMGGSHRGSSGYGHGGRPALEQVTRNTPSLADIIERAAQQANLEQFSQIRGTRGGGMLLSVHDKLQATQYIVSGNGALQPTDGPGWVRMLHEGTWAGAWSGVFTLLSTFPLLGLLVTGMLKWWRRTRAPRTTS